MRVQSRYDTLWLAVQLESAVPKRGYMPAMQATHACRISPGLRTDPAVLYTVPVHVLHTPAWLLCVFSAWLLCVFSV